MKNKIKKILYIIIIVCVLLIPISKTHADAGWHSSYGGGGSSHGGSSHHSHNSSSSSSGPSRPMTARDFKLFCIAFGSISGVLLLISTPVIIGLFKSKSNQRKLKNSVKFKKGDDSNE
jgi:hypothetical protein